MSEFTSFLIIYNRNLLLNLHFDADKWIYNLQISAVY